MGGREGKWGGIEIKMSALFLNPFVWKKLFF
jgi:hypothetical protein